jgi:hypothetical protein
MDHTTRRLSPIPMDDRIMQLALQMKQAGLPWEPAVGCFVWDREEIIAQPSPFPKRIYFILSMKRFMAIFGDVEKMKHRLVWLPTWYQARQIIHRLQIGDMDRGSPQHPNPSSSPEAELAGLYQHILCHLQASDKLASGHREMADDDTQKEWVRSVMASDVGDVSRFPRPVRDRIESIYDEVGRAYLGWRRIQENQTQDWLPRETAFEKDLIGDLGHFYSDYQHAIKSLDRIRKAVHLLGAVDEREDRDNYDRLVALILENDHSQLARQTILEELTTGDTAHPIS